MIDKYFTRPIFWDYSLALLAATVMLILRQGCFIGLLDDDQVYQLASDISTTSLTAAGFVLTLLTVLITFKGLSPITIQEVSDESESEETSLFKLFFASKLYDQTTKHIKNCIKSLLVIALMGYGLKLAIYDTRTLILFYFNIIGITVVILTLWRCLLILSKILKIQEDK